MHKLGQLIRFHPRLLVSLLAGGVVAVVLPSHMAMVTRLLVGWNVAVWMYLVQMAWLMMRANHEQVRSLAEQEDETGPIVLVVFCLAALVSLVAIIMELSTANGLPLDRRLAHYLLTGATVLGTWFLVATLFTFHYARAFYRADPASPPLMFPEHEPKPNYWDFLYFSFTIAAASQTGDVNIMSRSLRKTALAQTILSFFYNVTILGFAINIAAGVAGS